jgi:hypothetical protein
MKLLTFLARSFRWRAHSKTLADAPDAPAPDGAEDAVVVFLHAEEGDEEQRVRCRRHVLKHTKWLAGKRGFKRVVLHSFTHLGGTNAGPDFAADFLGEIAERLTEGGYEVKQTPFGHFCEWELAVYGESLAKVWKQI